MNGKVMNQPNRPQIRKMKLTALRAHPRQGAFYRTSSPEKLAAVADNTAGNGLQQPIVTMPADNIAAVRGTSATDITAAQAQEKKSSNWQHSTPYKLKGARR
jgi:hypothetical protein